MMIAAHKRNVMILLGLFGLLCAAAALLNICMDPYSVWRDHYRPDRYTARPESALNSRLEKIAGIIRHKPTLLILGSSIVNHAMYRGEPEIAKILAAYPEAYDAGVNGGTVKDQLLLFKHAYANNPALKEVLVGVDIFGLEWKDGSPEQIAGYRLETLAGRTQLPAKVMLQLLLGYDALKASLQMLPYYQEINKHVESFLKEQPLKVESPGTLPPLSEKNPEDAVQIGYTQREMLKWKFRRATGLRFLDEETLSALKEFVAFAKDHHIAVHFFIHASPAIRWIALEQVGSYEYWYEKHMRLLVAVAPMLDFSIYEPFYHSGEASNPPYFNGDNLHYPPSTGAFILQKILSGDVADTEVTSANLETHLAHNRAVIAAWGKRNPELVEAVLRFLPEEKRGDVVPWK